MQRVVDVYALQMAGDEETNGGWWVMRTVQLLRSEEGKEEFYLKKIDSIDGRWTDEVNNF